MMEWVIRQLCLKLELVDGLVRACVDDIRSIILMFERLALVAIVFRAVEAATGATRQGRCRHSRRWERASVSAVGSRSLAPGGTSASSWGPPEIAASGVLVRWAAARYNSRSLSLSSA